MSHIKMAVNSLLFGTFLFFSNYINKNKKILTQFAGNKTSPDAYFQADNWMEIESLLY